MSQQSISTRSLIERYQFILEAMSEGVYGLDANGLATFVNPAAERLTGWEGTDLIGKSIHSFHHHSHSDGRHYPQMDCPIYQCLQDGITRSKENEVFWRKDGSSFSVEYSATPIILEGSIQGAVVVFKNISERKRMEDNLKQALTENRFLKEKLQAENHYLQEEIDAGFVGEIIGQSPPISHLKEQIALAAPTQANILITGESGTGKELVARAIHQQSAFSQQAMVKLNCGAIPEGLVDSELFGHEKGAFTGAIQRRIGRFELANNGTLFLDEVSELPLDAQVKLLRVLQEGEFERVGGTQTIKVNVRIIAASNKDLKQAVDQNTFRMDLFYRLNVFAIHVPALRERKSDIPLLVHDFARRACKNMNKPYKGLHTPSLKWMSHHNWPGNIRELQNWVEHNAILHQSGLFQLVPMHHGTTQQTVVNPSNKPVTLEQAEREHIQQALAYCNGKVSGKAGAAELLDLPASTLRSRMKKLRISN
ncbi:sigma-54-dependent Fis family transcriptional regulator [Oceaniserpentilla sp. 4NH20-0058]|uniref:sigma-54 interaction domain-containing protein n=1 Tax=Oceaniserpentilla sp. 4NH20-0058 TaxID=3127660 RepID=UPI003101D630